MSTFTRKKRGCRFCADSEIKLDYKDRQLLEMFVSEHARIVPSRISGNCAFHQRAVTTAVKRARQISILPYALHQL
ncbi:MAG: 30S ribosomal protein S18 [Deltaproteobacteria bacterium RIFCSPHIGHO2_02_FULL_40_11]|nr:MAG: 30S ribosomal protein S18 [Deltaproteobacteria bacterium RIFCSPHIGHO2_02_FULL_40_11]